MANFSACDLEEIIDETGQLLEQEVSLIRKALGGNPTYSTEKSAIADFDHEAYYQRLLLTAILPTFRFKARLECDNRYDISLFDGDSVVISGELKCYMGGPQKNLAGMKKDMKEKLSDVCCSKFLVVFTKNPKCAADKNIAFLFDKLGCSGNTCHRYSFDTIYPYASNEIEQNGQFGVIGILLQ